MNEKDKAMWVHTLWDPLDEMHQSPLNSSKEGIRVAAYCRVSSGKKNVNSLENQVSYYSNYIYNKPNWKFVGVYMDDGISGGTIRHRPGFMRMLRHAKEGKIDLILTKSIARFSRNTQEFLEVIQELKDTGTTLYFEREGAEISKGVSSLVVETHAAMAQEYIESLSNSIKMSYRKRINEGLPHFNEPYGYDLVQSDTGAKLVIHEEEARVVRWVFDQFIEGRSYTDIAGEMIKKGIRTKKGNENWSSGKIGNIIKNISYTGNKQSSKKRKDLLTGKYIESESKGESFLILDSHPQIIAQETFDKAQMRVQSITKPRRAKKKKMENPLRSRMVCGRCGKSILMKGIYSYWCADAIISSDLCDAVNLKRFEPMEMGLQAIFSRMLGVKLEVQKEREKITFKVHDPKERSEAELNNDFLIMLRDLEKMLKRINQNDNFEFHRLKFFTEIEIATIRAQDETVAELREAYKVFEEKADKIEEDRKYREEVLDWLKTTTDLKMFIEDMTIERVRAWILSFTVFSNKAFYVDWIDETQTIIGEEEIFRISEAFSIKKAEREKQNASQNNLASTSSRTPVTEITKKENLDIQSIKRKGEETVPTLQNKRDMTSYGSPPTSFSMPDVVKLEDGLTIKDLDDLKNSILRNRMSKLQGEEKKKLRVAAYCRVSSLMDEQQLSFQTQLAYYNYKILSNPSWEFAGIYADEGISGTNKERRDDFNRMIKDAKSGKIDMILTKSVSRFGRNVVDVLDTLKDLNELEKPCICYFEKEGLKSNDPNSRLILSLMATVAEEEVLSLSNSISWGMQRLAQRGTVNRATDIYGYHIDKNRVWHIVEEEATVVRLLFEMYAEGKTIYEIMDYLKKKRIKTKKGNDRWHYNTIKIILENEKYIGDYEYQKYVSPKLLSDQGIKKNNGLLPKYYIEEHHEAIIEKELFERVQELMEENRRTDYVKKNKDGTAGRPCYYKKILCKECGHLVARYGEGDGTKHGGLWRCRNSSKISGSTCKVKESVLGYYLDYNFHKTICKLHESKRFRKWMNDYLESLELSVEEKTHMQNLEKEIKELNEELYKAVDLQVSERGKDTTLINNLTNQIIDMRNQHTEYINRIEKKKDEENRLNRLVEASKKMKLLNAKQYHNMKPRIGKGDSLFSIKEKTNKYTLIDIEVNDHFPEALFEEHVLSATMDKKGNIKYRFADDFEFWIYYSNEDYTEELEEAIKETKLEELLNSKEVKKIKAYCKVPRKPKEIFDHLRLENRNQFNNRFIIPLCEAGKLVLIPGQNMFQNKYKWQKGKS